MWDIHFVLVLFWRSWREVGEDVSLGRTAILFSSWSWSEIDVEIGGSLERTSTLLSSIDSEIDMGHLP